MLLTEAAAGVANDVLVDGQISDFGSHAIADEVHIIHDPERDNDLHEVPVVSAAEHHTDHGYVLITCLHHAVPRVSVHADNLMDMQLHQRARSSYI